MKSADIDQLETRIVLLSTYARNLEDRIGKLETGAVCDPIIIADMAAKIEELQSNLQRIEGGNSPIPVPTMATTAMMLHDLTTRLGKIEHNTDEMSDAVDRIIAREGYGKACTAAIDRAKPTIKGGWLNVYRNHSAWHPTRDDAVDCSSPGRIACIQIPDFTEGEGL